MSRKHPRRAAARPERSALTGAGINRLTGADWAWIALLAAVVAVLVTRNHFLGLTEIPLFRLGPLTLSPFGAMVALDLLFAYYLIRRWCLRCGLEWDRLSDGLVWIAALGIYISHLASIALYFPHDLTDPIALIDVRTRLSSFGGFFGGAVVAVIFMKRRGLPIRAYGDAIVYGFVGGYIFGRAGCFAIHDHPGRATDSPLGVEIAGTVRHDLGFYELWLMLGLLLVLHWVARNGRPPDGRAIAVACMLYAPVRFAFDFLRIDDVRYAGLTPGQWLAIPLFLVGLAVGWRSLRVPRVSAPHDAP